MDVYTTCCVHMYMYIRYVMYACTYNMKFMLVHKTCSVCMYCTTCSVCMYCTTCSVCMYCTTCVGSVYRIHPPELCSMNILYHNIAGIETKILHLHI